MCDNAETEAYGVFSSFFACTVCVDVCVFFSEWRLVKNKGFNQESFEMTLRATEKRMCQSEDVCGRLKDRRTLVVIVYMATRGQRSDLGSPSSLCISIDLLMFCTVTSSITTCR